MKTGYFARAKEDGHNACDTQVHIVREENNTPICGYKPHKTMQFLFCAGFIHLEYVECGKCKELGKKILHKEKEGE